MNSSLPAALYSAKEPLQTRLKRSRSLDHIPRNFNASRIPPLPRINGDLALQVFTHKSLRRPNVSPADYGDNERLADLGRTMCEFAITQALFEYRPMMRAAALTELREQLLLSTMVEDWVAAYKLMPKLRCQPGLHASLKLPQEIKSLFHAYVGGLYLSSGLEAVNVWIRRLLEQELELVPHETDVKMDMPIMKETPPQKRIKSEYMSPPLSQSSSFTPEPPQPHVMRYTPPHLKPMSTPPPNPLSPAQPNLPFLPLFNQAAIQRRVTVEYIAEFSGPAHARRWAVKCIVNNICKGEGSGNSKQAAKEEAARKAYYAMGWT
ncbi:hypothetical protein BDN70DRAFT_834000 [Pholiota conissans]|uniref:Uncharacterized protein n=1 Tax=Pholiota conissans TaxID=109636 RepID=A0A9P6D1I0_9AGAR|nr:hypothetical protein BDN70DRAFT_834000 [Pholiota conissans]